MHVECATAVHKTCKALNLRHAFLPLTAPSVGVVAGNWAVPWQKVRVELGVTDLDKFPVMPAPGEDGEALVRPLTSVEARKWVNMLLRKRCTDDEELCYTSHSFKATCLSYLAKFGASFQDRLALGYHVDQLRMALRYSRDGASRPLRVLDECLDAIRKDSSRPDETRSGRFVSLHAESEVIDCEAPDSVIDVEKSEVKSEAPLLEWDGDVIDVTSDHATTCSESSSNEEAVLVSL